MKLNRLSMFGILLIFLFSGVDTLDLYSQNKVKTSINKQLNDASATKDKKETHEVKESKHEKTEIRSFLSINDLVQGNKRFITGKISKKSFAKQRKELVKGQNPSFIIVTCSDSRVPPEHIFDRGLGELFVIRTAGNVLDSVAIGSIEYAAEHLHTPHLIILGHTSCGAVKAAMEGETDSPYINTLIRSIKPAVVYAKANNKDEDKAMKAAIIENVKNQIETLDKSKILKELIEEGKLDVKGAIYDLKSGKVDYIKE